MPSNDMKTREQLIEMVCKERFNQDTYTEIMKVELQKPVEMRDKRLISFCFAYLNDCCTRIMLLNEIID